ncbi:PDCD5-related protein [Geopyxis carbonaria]|nr:PDCD5-related protein [Geopyxis carbonaria]
MDDSDLAKIRAARMQELQGQQGGGGEGVDSKKQQEDAGRKALIAQICTPEAVDRLGRIAMVKEERARALETRLVMLARSNQLRAQVTEEELIKLIGMMDEDKKEDQKIVFSRRRPALDDDDDFDF